MPLVAAQARIELMARLCLVSVRWASFAMLGFGEREHSRVLVVVVAAGPAVRVSLAAIRG